MVTVTPALIEGQLAAVLSYIEAHYNDYIDAVNAKYSDGVTLSHVLTASVVESERATSPELPAVLVMGGDSSLIQEDPTYIIAQHDISVILVDTAQEQDDLKKKMYRHALAMFACLKAGSQASAFKLVRWRQPFISNSPIYTNVSRTVLFSDCRVLFSVQSEEAF